MLRFTFLTFFAAQLLPVRTLRAQAKPQPQPRSGASGGRGWTPQLVTMRHSSTSGAPAASTAATPDDVTAVTTGVSSLRSEGIATGVGKAASALLAKHVRTLEVLHSLQRENAKLRLDIQEKPSVEEIERRIAEAVAAAVAGPNDLAQELQLQGETLRGRVTRLEEEVAFSKESSAKVLGDARNQMECLRAENNELREQCKTLTLEASDQAQRTDRQENLESELREASATLALAKGRADDLAERLGEVESASHLLQLQSKEKDDTLRAMKAVEATLQSAAGENKARLVKLEEQVREAREKLEASEAERELLAARLGQASREKELSRKTIEDGSTKEQALSAKVTEQEARASAAEARLSREMKRLNKQGQEREIFFEAETRRQKQALAEYAYEREELLGRVDALSREILALRAQMNNGRSPFSKYVEAKTENTHLKEELDGLREMIVAPRPPKRSNSFGSSAASVNSGGLNGKTVSVERLRHSISVARGRSKSIVTASNDTSNINGSPGSSAGGRNQGYTSRVTLSPGEQALHHPHHGGAAGAGTTIAAAAAAAAAATGGHSVGGGWTGAQSSSYKLPAPAASNSSMWPVRGSVG